VLVACAVAAASTQAASAQEARMRFDIPSAPAASAIAEFARQAKANVLASGEALSGVVTNEVRGTFTLAEAVDRLLEGTALAGKVSASGAVFVIARPLTAGGKPASPAMPPVPAPPARSPGVELPRVTRPAEKEPPTSIVTISGSRQAMVSGIERKKNGFTIADAVAAEDIGQFPDKNIGEALSRITGVQIASDFGEGNRISIRGVQPDLNRIEINGMLVLSTSQDGTRAPELRELPSELIKSIDVVKGVTADTTEGGLGGTVVIQTNRPFDFSKFTIASSLAAERNSLRGGVQPRGNLLIADRFFGGRLGLMANLVYDKVLTRADRVRNTGWRFMRDWDQSPGKTVLSPNPVAAAIGDRTGCGVLVGGNRNDCERQWYDYSPGVPRYGLWTRDHSRSTGEFTAQYRFADGLTGFASWQRFQQQSRFIDLNYQTEFVSPDRLAGAGNAPAYGPDGIPSGGSCVTPPTGMTPAGMVVANHHVTEYVVGDCVALAGRGGSGAFSTQARDFRQRVDTHYRSGGLRWRSGRWDAEAMVSDSDAAYASDTNFLGMTMNVPGLKVSLDGQGLPHFTFPSGASPEDPAAYTTIQMGYTPVELDSFERQAKLDVRYLTTWPVVRRLAAGIQRRTYGSLRYADGGYLRSAGNDLASTADDVNVMASNVRVVRHYDPLNPGPALRPPAFQTFIDARSQETWVDAAAMQRLVGAILGRTSGFLQNSALSGFPAGWVVPDYAAAARLFDTSAFTHENVRQAPGSDGRMYPQIPSGVEERVRAAYLRADYAFDLHGYQVEGNLGMRYAGTSSRSTGRYRVYQRVAQTPGSTAFQDYLFSNSIVVRDNTYHDFLPSLNAALWLQPERLVLRAGYGKVLARPSLDQLNPDFVCIVGSGDARFGGDGHDNCTGGNPDLKPYRAENLDLSLEWYPRTDSQLSVAWFRKDISTSVQAGAQVRKDLLGNGMLYDVTTTVNARGATTSGVEVASRAALTFLPGVLRGLGVDASFTRMSYAYAPGTALINPIDRSVLPFPGMSRHAYNVSLWYDLGPLNARLAYIRRAGYYTGINDSNTGNPLFAEASGSLDAKLQMRLDRRWSVSLEAKNLADERTLTTAGALSRPTEYSWSGRRYYLGVAWEL
jgi:TonB-dependent receptor